MFNPIGINSVRQATACILFETGNKKGEPRGSPFLRNLMVD